METKQKTLGDMVPEVPKNVQDGADAYASALRSLGKAKGKLNTSKEVLIEAMKEAEVTVVEIDTGNRRIVLSATDKLSIKKVKQTSEEDGDEE